MTISNVYKLSIVYIYLCYNEYSEIKKKNDETIKQGGFKFDKNAQLIHTESDGNVELDQAHNDLLNRWNANLDPLIPLKPVLDKLFDLSNPNRLYTYPNDFNVNSFDYKFKPANQVLLNKILNGNIHQICEKNVFLKYYTQFTSSDAERMCLLSHLFYYATCFTDDCRILIAFETLASLLIENKFANINWKINASMLLQVYTNVGLNVNELQAKFPDLVEDIEKREDGCIRTRNASLNETKREIDEKTHEIFNLILTKLLNLLLLSLKRRSHLYDEEELDFIFVLLMYTSLDESYERLNVRTQTKLIIGEIIDAYPDETWNEKKRDLCDRILLVASKHHHRVVFLNMYLELSRSKRVKQLSFELAYCCSCKILNAGLPNEVALTTNELVDLLNLLNDKCVEIYTDSSYDMFCLLRCLDSILIEIINTFEEKEIVNKFINELKCTFQSLRRSVKDRLECQGRHQVKVILTNLISKCEYFLNENDRRKLTLSNTIFDKQSMSINDESISEQQQQQGDAAVGDDDEEPMSISEAAFEQKVNLDNSSSFANLSQLPSID